MEKGDCGAVAKAYQFCNSPFFVGFDFCENTKNMLLKHMKMTRNRKFYYSFVDRKGSDLYNRK